MNVNGLNKQFTCSKAVATLALAMIGTLWLTTASAKAEFANKDEAVAMVKKGTAFLKANGKDKTIAEVSGKKPQFLDRDLYLVIYDLEGNCLAHGANEKMTGRNMLDFKDIDGKAYIKERMELAKSKPSFWQDYKFTNPQTKKVEPKQMYCEKVDSNLVCGGVYR